MADRIYRCSAVDCSVNSKDNPDVKLFCFPKSKESERFCFPKSKESERFCFPKSKESERFAQWRKIVKIPEGQPSTRLCKRHFRSNQFRAGGLMYGAMPSYPFGEYNEMEGNYSPIFRTIDCQPENSSSPHNFPSVVLPNSSPLPTQSLSPIPFLDYPIDPQTPQTSFFTPVKNPNVTPKPERSLLKMINETRYKNLTPRKSKLIKFGKNQQLTCLRLKKSLRQKQLRLKYFADLKNNPEAIVKEYANVMTPSAISLFKAQLRNAGKKPKGSWTTEDKLMAASIYKKSPRCYYLLRSLISLPTRRTILSFINKTPLHPGINLNVFKSLKHSISNMKDELSGYCTLMFDEMSIKETINYNASLDMVIGYEDLGNDARSQELSSHALVFMAQGLFKKWKQPLAFYFTKNGMKAEQLVEIIGEVLSACFNSNLKVLATVCDMASTNVKSVDLLGSTEEHPFFWFEDKKIFTFFDPPHLLKCIRNMFLKHNILVPVDITTHENEGDANRLTMVAEWAHIKKAVDLDKNSLSGLRCMPKITDEHLNPKMQAAMKVKLASQIFSQSVGGTMDLYIRANLLPPSALATVQLIKLFNSLFDSVNGAGLKPDGYLNLRMAITLSNEKDRIQFWTDAIIQIKRLQFKREDKLRAAPLQPGKPYQKYFCPPSQTGWVRTLRAFIQFWDHLQNLNSRIQYLDCRRINQDPLENLFGMIRSQCGCCVNPTAAQFISAFKTSVINGLAFKDQKNTNCEPENEPAPILNSLLDFFQCSSCGEQQEVSEETEPYLDYENIHLSVEKLPQNFIGAESMAVEYVSGFVAKKILKNNCCQDCHSGIKVVPSSADLNYSLISQKERLQHRTLLTYPSPGLINNVGTSCAIFEEIFPTICQKKDLIKNLSGLITSKLDFSWLESSCNIHHTDLSKKVVCSILHIMIPWWCRRFNRTIKESKQLNNRRKYKILKHV